MCIRDRGKVLANLFVVDSGTRIVQRPLHLGLEPRFVADRIIADWGGFRSAVALAEKVDEIQSLARRLIGQLDATLINGIRKRHGLTPFNAGDHNRLEPQNRGNRNSCNHAFKLSLIHI